MSQQGLGASFLPVGGQPGAARHGRGTRAPRKEGFGAGGGGWMTVQQEQAPDSPARSGIVYTQAD